MFGALLYLYFCSLEELNSRSLARFVMNSLFEISNSSGILLPEGIEPLFPRTAS